MLRVFLLSLSGTQVVSDIAVSLIRPALGGSQASPLLSLCVSGVLVLSHRRLHYVVM